MRDFVTRVTGGSPRHFRSDLVIAGCLLVAGACVLRFYRIGTQSLWIDESFTLKFSDSTSIAATLRLLLESNGTERFSPLYPLLMHGVIWVGGTSEVALRSFSAICGVAGVMALMAAAAELFDNRAAVLAGVLFTSSSFAVWYSQEARPYSLMLLFVGLQLWALGRCLSSTWRNRPRTGRVWLAVISGVGLFGNILFAISSLSLCLAHLIAVSDRHRWWAAWWPTGVASLPAMTFYLASPIAGAPGAADVMHLQQSAWMNLAYTVFGLLVGVTFGPPQIALRQPDKLTVLGMYLPDLTCAGLLGLVLVVSIILAMRGRRRGDPRWVNFTLVGMAILIATTCAAAFVGVTRLNWQPRHAYFVFLPALLVVAFALSVLTRCSNQVVRAWVFVSLVAFLGANAWSLYNHYTQREYGKDDYRGAAAYLNYVREPGLATVLVEGSIHLLRYYRDAETIDLTDVPDSDLVPRLLELCRAGGEVVVVINRAFYWRGGRQPRGVFGTLFDVREHRVLQYFDIYRLAAKNSEVAPIRTRPTGGREGSSRVYPEWEVRSAATRACCRAQTHSTPRSNGTLGRKPRSAF